MISDFEAYYVMNGGQFGLADRSKLIPCPMTRTWPKGASSLPLSKGSRHSIKTKAPTRVS